MMNKTLSSVKFILKDFIPQNIWTKVISLIYYTVHHLKCNKVNKFPSPFNDHYCIIYYIVFVVKKCYHISNCLILKFTKTCY